MLEKEIPNLKLCYKLKELGYPQTGNGWFWSQSPKGDIVLVYWFGLDGFYKGEKVRIENGWKIICKVPNCCEIFKFLPDSVKVNGTKHILRIRKDILKDPFDNIIYENYVLTYGTIFLCYAPNLIHLLIKTFIWLKEKKLI